MYNRTYRGKSQHGKFVNPEDLLEDGLYGLGLDEELAGDDRLMEYITELMNWNRIYNLTSVRKPTEIVTRHILDSLSVIPHLNGDRILDIGTGAGLPGIPLAIACPEREFVLLDSSSKKLRFIQQTLGIIGSPNSPAQHVIITSPLALDAKSSSRHPHHGVDPIQTTNCGG